MLPDRSRESGIRFDWKDVVLIHAKPPEADRVYPIDLARRPDPRAPAYATMPSMPVLVLTVLLYFARRIKPTTVALLMLESWRRLPPQQRQQLLLAARRHGPRMASSLVRRRGLPRA
jgi:hypothetical protein